jgi:hypothetical protein
MKRAANIREAGARNMRGVVSGLFADVKYDDFLVVQSRRELRGREQKGLVGGGRNRRDVKEERKRENVSKVPHLY